MQNHTFWDEYKTNIMPKLEELDILLKVSENKINISEVSKALVISKEEISEILDSDSIKSVDKKTFLMIMEQGSAFICKLYKRELECGSPHIYSQENISYIYNIPLDKVSHACKILDIEIITSSVLPLIFDKIVIDLYDSIYQ